MGVAVAVSVRLISSLPHRGSTAGFSHLTTLVACTIVGLVVTGLGAGILVAYRTWVARRNAREVARLMGK